MDACYEWNRIMWEEYRRLLGEVMKDEPMRWCKLGKMLRLHAMLRAHNRRDK